MERLPVVEGGEGEKDVEINSEELESGSRKATDGSSCDEFALVLSVNHTLSKLPINETSVLKSHPLSNRT